MAQVEFCVQYMTSLIPWCRYLWSGALLLISNNTYIDYKDGVKLLIHSQVWVWISNFIPPLTGHVITYPPILELKLKHVNKSATRRFEGGFTQTHSHIYIYIYIYIYGRSVVNGKILQWYHGSGFSTSCHTQLRRSRKRLAHEKIHGFYLNDVGFFVWRCFTGTSPPPPPPPPSNVPNLS